MKPNEIKIAIAGQEMVLRPTLRAACNLEHRYGGFEALTRAIADGSFTVIADIILEGAINHPLSRGTLELGLSKSLPKLDALVPQLLSFILALCGIDESKIEQSQSQVTGKLESFADHHTKLFRIATGWLGWTPQEAWNSSPLEIIEAFKGRSEMLGAIFGTAQTPEEQTGPDMSPLDRAGLLGLKALQ
jgi:hypothetical protein